MTAARDGGAPGSAGDGDLGEVMSRIARRLQERHGDVGSTLQEIATTAVATVPHAEDCGISYVISSSSAPGTVLTAVATMTSMTRRPRSGVAGPAPRRTSLPLVVRDRSTTACPR